MSEVIVIAAVSENNVIGKNGKIPWHIPEDFQHFKKLTLNHPVIMGRRTYESLPVKPLKDRVNIVLSRENLSIPGAVVKNSLKDALEFCKNHEKIFIIGGQSVFEEGLKVADTLEITKIHKNYDGDTFFPEINYDEWILTNREDHDGYSFLTYKRKSS